MLSLVDKTPFAIPRDIQILFKNGSCLHLANVTASFENEAIIQYETKKHEIYTVFKSELVFMKVTERKESEKICARKGKDCWACTAAGDFDNCPYKKEKTE